MVHPIVVTDDDIHAQLHYLNSILEPSLKGGDAALAAFHQGLDHLVTSYSAASGLSADTHLRVNSFIKIINIMSSAVLETEIAADKIQVQLEKDISRLAEVDFKRLSIHDSPTSQAPYIETCYLWLLSHLHNPYPTKAVRAQFADQSGASEKDIDSWFIDTRKRIGWNDIRRAYFDTRFDMVKAATRHFKPPSRRLRPDSNPDAGPSSDLDYSHHFVTMESNARSLYSHKFFPTSLASNLGRSFASSTKRKTAASSYPSPERTPSPSARDPIVVTDGTTERGNKRRRSDVDRDSVAVADPRPSRPLKRSRFLTPSIVGFDVASSLPSPAQSIGRDLSSSPAIRSTSPEEVSLSGRAKRKRRQSDASDYDSDASRAPRARQRRRGVDTDDSVPPDLATLLKSESANRSQTTSFPFGSPSSSTASFEQAAPQNLKRKRRLSDSQDDRPRKLPHHVALMAPRLHTVSNPLPVPHCVSGLDEIPGSLSTEIPGSAETLDLYQSSNVEVESFDYGSFSALSDYLHQTNATSLHLDGSRMPISETITPSGVQLSAESPVSTSAVMDPFPILDIDFPTTGQVSLSFYDEFFQDIPGAGSAVLPANLQRFPSNTDKQMLSTLNPTFTFGEVPLSFESPEVNSFGLLLNPVGSSLSVDAANLTSTANPLGHPSGPAFGDASQVNFAIQKIQTLQAELEMCKTQLAQHCMLSF